MRAIARIRSVDLSITITAAVPRPERSLLKLSKSIGVSMICSAGTMHRRAAGDHGLEVVPAAADAAAMLLDQLTERDAHGFVDVAGPLDMAGDAEQLGADIVRTADAGEPGRTTAQDVRSNGNGLDVVDGGRAAVQADIGRERRLQPRLALLALEAFEQRGFLAADIGAGAVRDVDVERPAIDVVLADQLGLIGLVDRGLEMLALADEFAADIDVAGVRVHRAARDQAAFDQEMRIMPHDLAILAGAGLGLVGVDDEIARPAVGRFLRHERPFQAGREAGAATATQAGGLHLVDDPVAALVDDTLGAIPGAAAPRTLEPPIVEAVEVLEDAVLVLEHISAFRSTIGLLVGKPGGADGEGQRPEQTGFQRRVQDEALQQEDEGGRGRGMHGDEAPFLHGLASPNCPIRETAHQVVSFSVVGPLIGAENWRPFCGPGFGGLPEAKPSSTLPKLSLVRSSYVSLPISTLG